MRDGRRDSLCLLGRARDPQSPYAPCMRTRYPSVHAHQCGTCGTIYAREHTCPPVTREYPPCCEAPGCTREIARAERLCAIHQALEAGEAPRLFHWQLDEIYRRLGDPQAAVRHTEVVAVPGIGHVTMVRRRCEIEGVGTWFEWSAVAA